MNGTGKSPGSSSDFKKQVSFLRQLGQFEYRLHVRRYYWINVNFHRCDHVVVGEQEDALILRGYILMHSEDECHDTCGTGYVAEVRGGNKHILREKCGKILISIFG